ncbi:hypothetical protein GD1_193 [Paraglaciecola Antarctic GD virus 1]|nr:hypothetical protein GD1_193 [Paraglaciecola Antarctic GD virus 1]
MSDPKEIAMLRRLIPNALDHDTMVKLSTSRLLKCYKTKVKTLHKLKMGYRRAPTEEESYNREILNAYFDRMKSELNNRENVN